MSDFTQTQKELDAGDLYVHCPRRRGRRTVLAYTQIGNVFTPSRCEDFPCPLCSGTGEADADLARDYIERMGEED